jgi:hypothetical protein
LEEHVTLHRQCWRVSQAKARHEGGQLLLTNVTAKGEGLGDKRTVTTTLLGYGLVLQRADTGTGGRGKKPVVCRETRMAEEVHAISSPETSVEFHRTT